MRPQIHQNWKRERPIGDEPATDVFNEPDAPVFTEKEDGDAGWNGYEEEEDE
jgi:hypothetical protein